MNGSSGFKTGVRDMLIRCIAPIAHTLYTERPRVRVLSLHDITPENQDAFAKKIEWLAKNYNIVSLGEAYAKTNLHPTKTNVAITFDDGYLEHYMFASPLLRKLNIPATFFIPSGGLDLTSPQAENFSKQGVKRSNTFAFMTKAQVRELSQYALFEIGGHTTNHADFGAILSWVELEQEISGDKRALEEITGKTLRFFAYPFGNVKNISREAMGVIKKSGYMAAFTIIPSYWSKNQNLFLVGRDSLDVQLSNAVWAGFLSGGYDTISKWKFRKGFKEILGKVMK